MSAKKLVPENAPTRLTGLLTRHDFHHMGSELVSLNEGLLFAVLVLDIDNFKSVNVFCGREKGDELLVYIASFLREYQNDLTLVSHFRADTFAILTHYTDDRELIDLALRIHSHIEAFELPFKVLPAIGICALKYKINVNSMCDYAMLAMNRIKGKFYAKYNFFKEDMFERLIEEKRIENDVVSGLPKGELRAYVQPKVDLRNGNIIGGEALVRWHHPERGIVPPGQFIPVIEKSGLIIDVDYEIWRQIFEWQGLMLKEKRDIVPISVNISRMHAFDQGFKDRLISLSETYMVPPRFVILELTESTFLNNAEMVFKSMRELMEYGFPVSMDDFGTGYSTMTMLKNQPVNEVKIDKGFIDNIENGKAQIILNNITNMLKELDKQIIIEGVETDIQRDFLIKQGLYDAQGFLYYKPMPISEYEELLFKDKVGTEG